ncbi:MAG: DUF1028 domain-containing protein [Flavobacteriales bacterium]
MRKLCLVILLIYFSGSFYIQAQDTFSIVAVDTVTGEVGSAGASCVDMFTLPGYATDFLGELFPGIGAINTQAAYHPTNQVNARNRMNAGDTPAQIIAWLQANDVSGTPDTRQYGIVRIVSGAAQTAGHTGVNCMNYKNHVAGPTYCIQGNILLSQAILDSMETRFNAEQGDLACKLMAALQGANVVGADTRCATDGTSSLFAFLKVSQPSDIFGSPSFLVSVKTPDNSGIEPIDSLQILFDNAHAACSASSVTENPVIVSKMNIFPNPAEQTLRVEISDGKLTQRHFTVHNMLGDIILRGNMTSVMYLDVSVLKSGMYVLEVSDGITLIRSKFMKN